MYPVRTSAAPNMTEQFMGIAKFVQSLRFKMFQIHPMLHTVHTSRVFYPLFVDFRIYKCEKMTNGTLMRPVGLRPTPLA